MCDEYKIELSFSSRSYLQANGQAEAGNKTIPARLKRKLEAKKRKWSDVLLQVIWAYRTSVREATRTTPYALVFKTEEMISIKFLVPTPRTELPEGEEREAALRQTLLLAEKRPYIALVHLKAYHQRVKKYFNAQVKKRAFQ